MKFLLIFIFFITIPVDSFAGNKEFFDPINKKMVVDLSGKKTLIEIKNIFGMSEDTQEIVLGEGEVSRIINNKIEKYNYIEGDKLAIEAVKNLKMGKIDKVRVKLGLTKQEMDDLVESLK